MKAIRRQSKISREAGQAKSAREISPTTLREDPGKTPAEKNNWASEAGYWLERLIARRYFFPASGVSQQSLAAYINYADTGYFFPLGTTDIETGAAKACRIYRTVAEQGWTSICQEYPRELIISFEWCMNPVLWTYTTIHTLVGKRTGTEPVLPQDNLNRRRVLVVEADDGIRRALCWSIDNQAGYVSVPCVSPQSYPQMLAFHKPCAVLLSRNLAGAIGFKSAGTVAPIHPGVPAITYSVHADGDRMFVSTPGGAVGYLVKRVPPDRLLEPIVKAINRSDLTAEDFLVRVKYYFQELLQLPSSHDNSTLAKLTPREREVLELLSKGYVDKEIAQAMGIGVWTVHDHVKNIFDRLGVRTRTEAAIRYLEK